MAKNDYDSILTNWKSRSNDSNNFYKLVASTPTLQTAVITKYNESLNSDNVVQKTITYKTANFIPLEASNSNSIKLACTYVFANGYTDEILEKTASKEAAIRQQNINTLNTKTTPQETDTLPEESLEEKIDSAPFDKRLNRMENSIKTYTPYSTQFKEVTTSGYLMPKDTLGKLQIEDKLGKKLLENWKAEYERLKNDGFYTGVPALQNSYALIRLYGAKGGSLLVNQKGQRRWYEVDTASDQPFNFASTPTTSALIDWGNGDPHGRTPYQFTDFVFSKYWKKIENNRLITLRRFAAPILDNLKFPGMSGEQGYGSADTNSEEDKGNSKSNSIAFPPMASAITYFGGETQNSLNNILKFTTGVLWEDAQAAVWEVQADSVPDNTGGISKIFGGIGKFAEILGVASDSNFNDAYIMNGGVLPPDPYSNGPYENRIMGPVNRIDSVKKRKPGLDFKMDNLNIVFEYVARPVGGINPKAILLDILSNFLVIGSASAVFFGGAHRFMANPAKYPFVGNIKAWYEGRPVDWSKSAIKQFSEPGGMARTGLSNLWEGLKDFVSGILSGNVGEAFSGLFTQGNGAGNIIRNQIAKKTAGQVPYLQGLKAVLTGEPVGEWHITIGNPLNPIAMIGNLICEGIDVEFNEELGPDDFPTEMKITVKLKHGMARDRDAIESIFNRGMGRIYNLPDSMLGTADFQTSVDQPTQDKVQTGLVKDAGKESRSRTLMTSAISQTNRNMNEKQLQGTESQMGGSVSIWNKSPFRIGVSENSDIQRSQNELLNSSFRTANWIAQRGQL